MSLMKVLAGEFPNAVSLFFLENPAADIGDVQSRRVVLKRHQSPQFVNIEVRVSLLAERNADEGSR